MFEHRVIKPRITFLSASDEVEKDLSASVVSVQTIKRMNEVAGSFEIRLVPQRNLKSPITSVEKLPYLYKNVSPMDLIAIGFQNEYGKMLGIVDQVFKQKVVMNQGIRREIVIRGRDFGKILIEDRTTTAPSGDNTFVDKCKKMLVKTGIVKNAREANEHPLAFFYTENRAPDRIDPKTGGSLGRSFVNVTIKEAIEYVFRNLTSLRIKLSFGGKENVSAKDILLGINEVKFRLEDRISSTSLNSYNGSIANFLSQLIDKDFYEVWIDSIDRYPVLIVRPKPYDRIGDQVTAADGTVMTIKSDDEFCWENLQTLVTGEPYHIVPEEDIVNLTMGVSDFEVFSMYQQTAMKELVGITHFEQHGLIYPLIDFATLKRYGLRLIRSNSQLIKVFDEDLKAPLSQDEVLDRIRGMRDRVFNWNRYNAYLESGTVVVKGSDKYRIGDKVLLKDEISREGDRGILAYCVGVDDIWRFGQPYLTTLHLIRGESKKILDEWNWMSDPYVVRAQGEKEKVKEKPLKLI